MTFMQFLEKEWRSYRSERFVDRADASRFIKFVEKTSLADVKLNKINTKSLRRFWLEVEDRVIEKNYATSYASQLRGHLNSALNLAVQKSYMADNMNYNLKSKTERLNKLAREQSAKAKFDRTKKIWTPEQVMKYLPLYKTMNKKPKNVDPIMWWAFMTIGLYTGLRRGELTGLMFSDFDREKRVLTVQRNVQITSQPREIRIVNPKAGSFGDVSYGDEVEEVLDTLEMYHQMNGTLKNEYLLQYKWGGLIDPNYWTQMFKRVQKIAGIPHSEMLPSAHYMRHTHLSLLSYQGFSIKEIQERARHTDPRTTSEYYIHLLEGKDREMADKFSELLNKERD
jgi:integrase